MNALTPAERAAMRNEWSLECRQVGLDHLADCFKKPAVENPADRASDSASSSSRPDPDANPVEAATADVVPTPCEADKLAFLNGAGAGGVAHTGNGKFDAHLLGVRRIMMSWVPDDPALADAGLFHSVYGTEGFQGFTLPYERRDDVRALIGERAERLVWIFCVVDRLSVDNDLDSPRARTRSAPDPSWADSTSRSTMATGSISSPSPSAIGSSRWRAPRAPQIPSSSGTWVRRGSIGGARTRRWRRSSGNASPRRRRCTRRCTRGNRRRRDT